MNQLSFSTDSLVESGYFQYHASVLTRQLNPRAGETIPAIVLEAKNQTMAERPTWETKTQGRLDTTAPPGTEPIFTLQAIVNLGLREH